MTKRIGKMGTCEYVFMMRSPRLAQLASISYEVVDLILVEGAPLVDDVYTAFPYSIIV